MCLKEHILIEMISKMLLWLPPVLHLGSQSCLSQYLADRRRFCLCSAPRQQQHRCPKQAYKSVLEKLRPAVAVQVTASHYVPGPVMFDRSGGWGAITATQRRVVLPSKLLICLSRRLTPTGMHCNALVGFKLRHPGGALEHILNSTLSRMLRDSKL